MSIFTDIAAKVEAFAEAAVAEGEKDFEAIIAGIEPAVEAAAEAVAPIVVTALNDLVDQLGGVASQLVLSLMGAAGDALTGSAKANLGATSLIDAAAKKGIALADSDASTLIKNAFAAVDDLVTSKLAPAG